MKRKFLIVLLALTLAIVSAFALTACGDTDKPDGGSGDNGNSTVVTPGGDTDNNGGTTDPEEPSTAVLKFNLLDDDTYEVIGYEGTPTKIVIPSEYNGKKVTRIGEQAFNRCSSLTSVTVPDSITSIGRWAFNGCFHLVEIYNLSSLNMEVGVYDDTNGSIAELAMDIYTDATTPSKLTKKDDFIIHTEGTKKTLVGYFGDKTAITFPDGITNVKRYSFYEDNSLAQVVIPDSAIEIEVCAFWHCENLTNVEIGNNVIKIGEYAFDWCKKLASIVLPDSVTDIGKLAFSRSGLTSITLGAGVVNVGENAFSSCYRLVEIYNLSHLNITKGAQDIGNVALYAMDLYTDKNAPSKLTKQDDFVVRTDNNLKTVIGYYGDKTEITVPSNAANVRSYTFYDCDNLTSVTISAGDIGYRAFYRCDRLTSVTIGNSVTTIDDEAFDSCLSLASVTMESGVTSIGKAVFAHCYNLTSITIPDSVTSIGVFVFSYCYRLVEIYNLSSLDLSITGCDEYVLDVYTNKTEPSKLTRENGFVIHTDGNVKTLVGYFGDKTEIIVPNGITNIKSYAFYNCYDLTRVTLPNSVVSIGEMKIA